MYYLCAFFKQKWHSYSSVAYSRTYQKQHIAFLDSLVCSPHSVHSQHSEKQRIVVRKSRNSHHCCNNRYLHNFRKSCNFLNSVRCKHATTYTDKWLFSFIKSLDNSFNLSHIALSRRLIASYFNLFRIFKINFSILNVHRNVNKHRPRSSASCDIKRFLHYSW